MSFDFTHVTEVLSALFKTISREKSTQDAKMSFFLGNELKLTQVELLSFFYFKNVTPTPPIQINFNFKLKINYCESTYFPYGYLEYSIDASWH